MQEFFNKLKEFQEKELVITMSRGALSIQQTERNTMKADILTAFYNSMKREAEKNGLELVFTDEGPTFILKNEKVEEQVYRLDDQGLFQSNISLVFDMTIKSLKFDPYEQEEYYQEMQKQKELKEIKKEAEKKNKIKRDAEIRAEAERERELRIERLKKLKSENEELINVVQKN